MPIMLEGWNVGVVAQPNGSKALVFTDPISGLQVMATLPEEGCRELAGALSGIVIARGNGSAT